jgi:hypothetical protein
MHLSVTVAAQTNNNELLVRNKSQEFVVNGSVLSSRSHCP